MNEIREELLRMLRERSGGDYKKAMEEIKALKLAIKIYKNEIKDKNFYN